MHVWAAAEENLPGCDLVFDVVLGNIGDCGMPQGAPGTHALQGGESEENSRSHGSLYLLGRGQVVTALDSRGTVSVIACDLSRRGRIDCRNGWAVCMSWQEKRSMIFI